GFESNEGVILIAATNRPDVLDPALLRPGRFDRRVVVPRPDLSGRLAVLKVHTRRVPLADDVKLDLIARGTPGFVGADLQNLVNEAALLASRRDGQCVEDVDFEDAKDKVGLGAERKSMIMSDEDKRITAYHESGHALIAMLLPDCDPVHKVTIIPRGMALGVTWTMPEADRVNLTKEQIIAQITHAMGGRAAEKLVIDNFSTGAANDLQQATKIARKMICSYGMNEKIGPVSLTEDEHDVFLGRDFMQRREYSENKAQEIDDEIKQILGEQYETALEMLRDHRVVLDRFAESLLERETLDGADLALLMQGKPLPPLPSPVQPDDASPPPERADKKPKGSFAGDKLPDPEPVAG
ncbi:MAG: ATP-dependent metallopeptidase FtsH/Yme1/Tma family protein, partial [Myxococcota bacterium]